jgi:hypothetical protein
MKKKKKKLPDSWLVQRLGCLFLNRVQGVTGPRVMEEWCREPWCVTTINTEGTGHIGILLLILLLHGSVALSNTRPDSLDV